MRKIEGSCHCGEVRWLYEAPLESATACNCTVCRRYGALWAYGYNGHEIKVSGTTKHYSRGKAIDFHFCANCGCVAYYLGKVRDEQGRQKAVVNLRLARVPEQVGDLLIDHFDGLDSFDDLPRDGRCVKDLWF